MISIAVDTAKATKLKEKLAKYPPYAIKQGLKAAEAVMNAADFKQGMYPPESNAPFVWSSERQRRAYFASNGFGAGIPFVRNFALADAGAFRVDESSFWITYENALPWAKYVIHPSYQIIGHRTRGWKPVNQYVVSKAGKITPVIRKGVLAAWADMEKFMFGGGGGL